MGTFDNSKKPNRFLQVFHLFTKGIVIILGALIALGIIGFVLWILYAAVFLRPSAAERSCAESTGLDIDRVSVLDIETETILESRGYIVEDSCGMIMPDVVLYPIKIGTCDGMYARFGRKENYPHQIELQSNQLVALDPVKELVQLPSADEVIATNPKFTHCR